MKKVNLILGVVLLVLTGTLSMFSCRQVGNGPPAPLGFQVGPAGGGDELPIGLGEALKAAMSGEGTAELTDEQLALVIEALNNEGQLKAGIAAASPVCTAGSQACSVSGSISYNPIGTVCIITLNKCNQGDGAVNGTVEVNIVSDGLVRYKMNLTVDVPNMDPVPVQVEMFIYWVTADSYLVVIENVATHTVAGADSCSVEVTWDPDNNCYTVDATDCPGGTFYDTCCLDEDADTFDTCDADNPSDTDGKEADCNDSSVNANPGFTSENIFAKILNGAGLIPIDPCADGIDNDCDGLIDTADTDDCGV